MRTKNEFWNECRFVTQVGLERRKEEVELICRMLDELKATEKDFQGGCDEVQFAIRFDPPELMPMIHRATGETHTAKLEEAGSIIVRGVLLPVRGDLAFWNGSTLFMIAELFPVPFRYKEKEFVDDLKERNARNGFDATYVIRDNEDFIETFFEELESARGSEVEALQESQSNLERALKRERQRRAK